MLYVCLQGIDELPNDVTSLMKMAVELPPIARASVSGALAAIGFVLLVGALICLARAANRQEKLQLSNPVPTHTPKATTGLSPAFQNPAAKSLSSK